MREFGVYRTICGQLMCFATEAEADEYVEEHEEDE